MIDRKAQYRLLILLQWVTAGICIYKQGWHAAAFMVVTLLASIAILQTEK